jgi:sensor histidine kinase YesM
LNAEKKLMQVSQKSRQQALLGWSALVILFVVIGWIITYSRKKQQLLRKEKEVEQLQHRMSETRQIALRAQMNPHFIFNCMAAIDHYILSNETKLASDLLTSFAGLIRTILEQSERELIPLEQELHSLNLYLQLEQIRFRNKFTYSIETIDNLDLDIPPLLLQPYVENAVLHGVSHLVHSQPGEIKIKVDQDQADRIRIMIRDNGVGTKESATINKRTRPAHQSMGTRITEERINLFRTMHQVDIQVSIKDLYPEIEQGTEVNILIGKLSEN